MKTMSHQIENKGSNGNIAVENRVTQSVGEESHKGINSLFKLV